ncbi:MAG: phosphodiester glycosidase family protein [Chloroflexales bacterium]|nr:phosphodiester glycosidase family protein [Chloroflexales bacterium]
MFLRFGFQPEQLYTSRWTGAGFSTSLLSQSETGLVDEFLPVLKPETARASLEQYNQGSVLQESVADGRVQFYRRDLADGNIAYFVVNLDEQVHLEVINADGATPSSDATGNTIWTDGQRHLATVVEMVHAPYTAREGMTLLGAMAFGFHGAVRTSNEGTVVINNTIHRVNPARAALCLTPDHHAWIGLFNADILQHCEQAIGAGPVVLWQGKIANPDVIVETPTFLPFNPLGEDFVQIEWRKHIYTGLYPKTMIGIGAHEDGSTYLVMMVSYGVTGIDVVRQLQEMGCTTALGGDDDTSTQAVWRGIPVRNNQVQEVPDALAIYLRQ